MRDNLSLSAEELSRLRILEHGETVSSTPDQRSLAFHTRLMAEVAQEEVSRHHGAPGQRTVTSATSARSRGRRTVRIPVWSVLLVVVAIAGFVVSRRAPSSEHVLHYHAPAGQRSSVQLADGSVMILAPSTDAAITSQDIEVSGEAYFLVAPHASRAFVVRTRNAVVQVVGTRFGVRQYSNESASRVVVQDGRVVLRAIRRTDGREAQTVLSARMLAQVTDSGVRVTSGIAIGDYIDWTQGRLVFSGVSLKSVAEELSRVYGTDVHVADSVLADQSMTMTITVANEPLTSVLDIISLTNQAHYTRVGKAFVLAPGRSAMQTPQRTRIPQPETMYGR